MTTQQKLNHYAAQLQQMNRELNVLAGPVSQGGAKDISLAASHSVGVAISLIHSAAAKLMRTAGEITTDTVNPLK